MFCTQDGLDRHISNKHKIPMFPCNKCKKILKTEKFLAKHIEKKHNPEKEMQHIRKINTDNPFKCTKCEHTCISKSGIDKHILTVHHAVTYECNICKINYTAKWYLATHIRNVHGNKKIVCIKCNKIFSTTNSLCRHNNKFHMQPDTGVI
jgi:uncharacterized C2H2 Zn-finger protein